MEIVGDNFGAAIKFQGTNRHQSARMSQLRALAQTLYKYSMCKKQYLLWQ